MTDLTRFVSWLQEYWSAMVALASIVLTVFELHTSRRHQRLSVRPELVDLVQLDENKRYIGFSVENAGLGPARILRASLTLAGKDVPSADHVQVKASVDPLLKGCARYQLDAGVLGKRFVMAQGTLKKILSVQLDANTEPATISEILDRFRAVGIHIYYESLYGERIRLKPPAPNDG
jgi:hypothetical protein